MELQIEEVYGELVNFLKQKYIIGNIEKNRKKMVYKLNNHYQEVKRFVETDSKWADLERINSYYKSSLTTCDLSIRINEDDIINLFKTVWKMDVSTIFNEKWNTLHINCYKAGSFVKDFFDYKYELEIVVDEEEEEFLYKRLFIQLPTESDKMEKYKAVFGTPFYKYKTVINDLISEHFKQELIDLKLGLDYSMDKLTIITKEKLGI